MLRAERRGKRRTHGKTLVSDLACRAARGRRRLLLFLAPPLAPKLDMQTAAATRGDVRRVVSTSGTVRALGTVEIGSQLSGNIGELNADFSSEVKQGQVLARIEPSTFETRVREEEAGLAIAKANVALQEATVQRAEANLHKAELDLRRAAELVARASARRPRSTPRQRRSRAPPPISPSPRPRSRTPRPRSSSARPRSTAPASISNAPISARRSTAW